MTTSKKLWLGFGIMTLITALSLIAIMISLGSVRQHVDGMAEARKVNASIRGLEINMLGYALNVRAYFQNGGSELRSFAEQDAIEVEQYLAEYQKIASTDKQRTMAAHFATVWNQFKAQNDGMMNAPNSQRSDAELEKFLRFRTELQQIIDQEMRADGQANYNDQADEAHRRISSLMLYALILFFGGTALAILTSWVVGRGIVFSEKEQWESKERLRVTLASIGDAVITTDIDGSVTYLNAVAEKLTGWTSVEAEGSPLDKVFLIVNETTREKVENPAQKAIATSSIVALANHTILMTKDGLEYPIDDSAGPIKDAKGNVIGAVLVFRDVSDRRKADAALHESQRFLRSTLDSLSSSVSVLDEEGKILTVNETWRRFADDNQFSGSDHCVGESYFNAFQDTAADEGHDIARGIKDVIAGTIPDFELEYPCHSPTERRWFLMQVTRFPGDGPVRVVVVHENITHRKIGEEMLRESDTRFRQLADAMPQIVWTAQPDGTLDYYNGRWYEYIDLGRDFFEDARWDKYIHPDDQQRAFDKWTEAINTSQGYKIEFRVRRADGEYRWFLAQALPVFDESGKVSKWFGTCTDIHEEKERENELRQLAANLSEADRRKNEFLAMLAHELRNPLAPIRNALQIMRLNGQDETKTASEMMERQVGQLVRLVDDLLDVSRITRGKIELRTGRIEMASFLNHAIEAARPSCEKGGVSLETDIPQKPIYLNGDPMRLAQAVGNLLNNACKFTNEGGRIDLIVKVDNSQALIRIKDTGIGIDAKQLPHIFDLFVQADTSLERSVSGLGIGLTLVKNLVVMHGGTVEAHSAGLGLGSEFIIRLPILIETENPQQILKPLAGGPQSVIKRRILVVDDNVDSAESLAMLLQLSGHEVKMAHDGREAVDTAGIFLPEVILLDIGLPRLNGYEAALEIRKSLWGVGMTLIALTGWGQDEDRQRSKAAGFDGHMVKPVDHAELMQWLDSLPDPDSRVK